MDSLIDSLELLGSEALAGWVALIKDILIAVAAIVGLYSLRQWRAELKGNARFELARRMVLLAFEFRERFHFVRNPFTFSSEYEDRPDRDASEEVGGLSDRQYAVQKRFTPLAETTMELSRCLWEARIVLDRKVANKVEPLEQSFLELKRAIRLDFGLQEMMANVPAFSLDEKDMAEVKARQKILYYQGEGDELDKLVNEAVDALVEHLERYVP